MRTRLRTRRFLSLLLLLLLLPLNNCSRNRATTAGPTTIQAEQSLSEAPVPLPNQSDSFKFAVLGDFGTGKSPQYDLAREMAAIHNQFKYEMVILVGDNIYGSERPQDFERKFEIPYKPLLDAGVKFYATLGNHDSREQRYYKLFNMEGQLYYTFNPKPDIRFFMLESTYPVPEQIQWLDEQLKASTSDWKIAVFHHPLYSSAERHGSDLQLREVLEPLFIKYNVSVVLNGHDHVYERLKPQNGIAYFVVGSGGQLRAGNLTGDTSFTAKGFDTDLVFMVAEIAGDQMYFNAISRTGQIVDSGVLSRRKIPADVEAGSAPKAEARGANTP
jgi:predicted phosphodiesterase